MAKSAVTPNTNTAMAKLSDADQLANLDPELLKQLEADAGVGVSDREEDRIQAWVKVLHQQSPELNPRDPDYVTDAKPGDIWIKSQNLLIDGEDGFTFQQCAYQLRWVEWPGMPGSGGQPIARFEEKPRDYTFGGMTTDEGHQIIETSYHLGIVYVKSRDPFPATISFASTGRAVSQTWTNIQHHKKLPNGKMAPAYLHLYHLKTIERTNDKGRWYLLDPKDAGIASAEQIKLGQDVTRQILDRKLQMGEGEGSPGVDRDPGATM
jgi:hypothetical protein